MGQGTQCVITGCGRAAHGNFSWGSQNAPVQSASLCEEHAEQLWQTLGPLCSLNHSWLIVDKPTLNK